MKAESPSIDNDFIGFAFCYNCSSYNSKTKKCAMRKVESQNTMDPNMTCSFFSVAKKKLIHIDEWHRRNRHGR